MQQQGLSAEPRPPLLHGSEAEASSVISSHVCPVLRTTGLLLALDMHQQYVQHRCASQWQRHQLNLGEQLMN